MLVDGNMLLSSMQTLRWLERKLTSFGFQQGQTKIATDTQRSKMLPTLNLIKVILPFSSRVMCRQSV